MAKLCMIIKENKRRVLSQSAKAKRDSLRDIIKNQNISYDERMVAVAKLSMRPRNESSIRVRTRCQLCGRPRAVYRKFGLCRIHLREAAMRGDIPGLMKSSW